MEVTMNVLPQKENTTKVMLILLPFWDPLVPPLGITSLKTFLENNGHYSVSVFDANIEPDFREVYDSYFNLIKEVVPEKKRKLLYNIGHEVLKNHTMVAIHRTTGTGDKEYLGLIAEIVYKTFYTEISEAQARLFEEIIQLLLQRLESYILEKIELYQPQVFGLSVYSGSLPASLFSFRLVKQNYPEITTIMGGPVFSNELKPGSPNYHKLLNDATYIDKIIEGEGELLLLNLLEGKFPQESKFFSKNDILGQSIDMNKMAVPDYGEINLDAYLTVSSSTARSCPFECSFCSETIFWGRYTKRQPDKTVEEMISLHKRYGKNLIFMCDSILNPVMDPLTSALQQVNYPIYFDGYFRIDKKSQELNNTLHWRRGGYYRARIGVESGSEEVLKMMHKNLTVEQIKRSIINLATAGIKTTAMFVVGHPGETEEQFLQTLQLIEEIQDYIYEADCNPFQFYYSGQVDSGLWESQFVKRPLYDERYADMIFSRTWTLDVYPQREIAYERANRFVEFVEQLGIYNPYKLEEIRKADERWALLHPNAVPSMLDLQHGNISAEERKRVKAFTETNESELSDEISSWDF